MSLAKLAEKRKARISGLALLKHKASNIKIGSTVKFYIDSDWLPVPLSPQREIKIRGNVAGIRRDGGVYVHSRYGDHYRKFGQYEYKSIN